MQNMQQLYLYMDQLKPWQLLGAPLCEVAVFRIGALNKATSQQQNVTRWPPQLHVGLYTPLTVVTIA